MLHGYACVSGQALEPTMGLMGQAALALPMTARLPEAADWASRRLREAGLGREAERVRHHFQLH